MQPSALQPEHFASYPPEARQLAVAHLSILRQLPLAFLPLLLREVIGFDWKFPVERLELTEQFRYLHALSTAQLTSEMKPFSALRLSPELVQTDWVGAPAHFSELLSAHLWATHQIESFRGASVAYVHRVNAGASPRPLLSNRLTMVVMGAGVVTNRYRLFRKLRAHGTYFSNVDPQGGRAVLHKVLSARAETSSQPFAHWSVEGGGAETSLPGVHCISYGALDRVRKNLVEKMRRTMQPGGGGPETLRTMMAAMTPADLGLPAGSAANEIVNRFQVSLLTEGSGTQLFSTTFVQWTARELLRRAQPLTLLTSYAPRQREQSMQEMLSGAPHQTVLDPEGSLIDADMGAYYTWINQQRLPGAAESSFLVWFEGGREVVAVGPRFARGQADAGAMTMEAITAKLA